MTAVATDTQPWLSYESHPHIIEAIIRRSDYKTKLKFRATGRAIRKFIDKQLVLDIIQLYSSDCACGSVVVTPWKESHYPFFSKWGNLEYLLPAAHSAKMMLRDVEAGWRTNLILGMAHSLSFSNHTPVCNFVLRRKSTFLAIHVDKNCTCGDKALSPAFSHRSAQVSIHLHPDSSYYTHTGVEKYAPSELSVDKGDKTRCHMLQNALNPNVRQLSLVFGAPVAEAVIEHLPAFVFPKAHTFMPDWELTLDVTFCSTSESPEIRKKARNAFAVHLRIPESKIEIEFDEEIHPGP